MKSANHIVGGYVFTGLVSSLLGWNIFSYLGLLIISFIGVLIPDIDHPKSLIGRLLFPISKPLNRRYGHRTLTHSVFFLIISTIIVALINNLTQIEYLAATYFIAVFSHVLLDMMTVSGVMFFYPISKHVFVIPGKESLRLSSSNTRAELVVLIVFFTLGFALQPLFKDGFWTTYNKSFATMSHLHSEFLKSNDMLFCDIKVKSGTLFYNYKGYAIITDASVVHLYDPSSNIYSIVPSEFESVQHIDFHHVSDMNFNFSSSPNKAPISILIKEHHYCNLYPLYSLQ